MKHILHIDMDAFFASVEAAKNPSIKNKPFIVTWIGKHSVVSSGNYLARSYGVKSGMPVYMAQLLCKNLLLVPLDFESYKEYHTKFIEIIKQKITRKIEVASIDECYVDISDNIKTKNEAMRLAYRIQKLIEEGLNITCSIGVSNNKFLAKMGSDFKKPNGLTKLYTTDVEKKLWPLPVKKMYMVGESSSALLEQNRIFTIGDIIKEQNETIIKEIFGSNTNWYINNALGNGSDELDYSFHIPKSFSSGTTFLDNTSNLEEIKRTISAHTHTITAQLNEHHLSGRTVCLSVATNRKQIKNKSITLINKVNSYDEIFTYVMKIYYDNFINKSIRAITVRIYNFGDDVMYSEYEQLDFFKTDFEQTNL